MRRAPVPCLLLLVACQSRSQPPPAPPMSPDTWRISEYTVSRLSAPPTIDGNLDDPAWKNVPWTSDFWSSIRFTMPTHPTRAKLGWDDKNLYVAFDVTDNDIVSADPRTGAPYNNDDDPLYMSEAVEIFLNAADDQLNYNEIEISPLDHIFDASFTGGRRQGMNVGWASGVKHAVQMHGTVNNSSDVDQGWTAELAIPFANLSNVPHLPPHVGDHWRFNLFRLDHGNGVGEEGQAFSPVMIGDFHNLPKYGVLAFGGPP